MSALAEPIRETIAAWLESGEIELFIGWETGPVPLRAAPAFVRRAEDVGRLIWDATCENNLAAYLPDQRGKKVGVMVKGCDARAVVGLLQEGQLSREDVRIVGVCCPGVVAPRKVAERLGVYVEDLDAAHLEGDVVVAGGERLDLATVLHDTCNACPAHNPEVYDVLVGDPIEGAPPPEPYAAVREMEALSEDERWARFVEETSRCNLCYACRNACPMCYCNVCFADKTTPRWVNPSAAPEDVQFFQIMRTFHLAGRCVGCGACTRACPQGANLRLFLDKLRADVEELYGYVAGVDAEAQPPLRTYRADDYNAFITEP